jgi:1-pyrroline-5-carboxylate dehydrogenase
MPKVTYVTLASNEAANAEYEAALARVRANLGASYPNAIDGRTYGLPGGPDPRPLFEDRDPADPDRLIARFPRSTPADVARALAGAKAAYPAWSGRPWQERVAILRAAAEIISSRMAELAAIMTVEVGKNRLEAMGDAEEAADLLRYYCQQVEDADGFVKPLARLLPNEDTRSVLRPYGVFGVIAPFNFPAALAAGMSGGALVAGNTVVFKPSSDAPLTGWKLYEWLTEAGVPAGVFQFVTGTGGDLGNAFFDEGFDGVVFTGSKAVGMDLYRGFAKEYPRPVICEMGGKNPAIVTRHADLQKAAEGVARSAFGYGGQKCSACSRAYVERPVYDAFLEKLRAVAAGLTVGDPGERGVYMGPVVNKKALARYESAVATAKRDGRVVFEGARPADPKLSRGAFAPPFIVDGLPLEHALFRDELFAPFLAVGPVDSLEEAIRLSNDSEYGLTAGIFSEDESEVQRFFDTIEAGVVYANRRTGATTGAWPGVQSFCGWKGSGSSGKGGCGPYYVAQFLREQSRTHVR